MPKGQYRRITRKTKLVKNCLTCNGEFFVLPCKINQKYCCKKCVKIPEKLKHCKPHTKEAKLKMSKTIKTSYANGRIHHYIDKKRDLATRIKISNTLSGSEPWNKDLGYSNLILLIKTSLEYSDWRTSVFKRDNYTCQDCKVRGGKLEAHHIIAKRKIIIDNNLKLFVDCLKCKVLWDVKNGLTLCNNCHKKTDNYGYKGITKSIYPKCD